MEKIILYGASELGKLAFKKLRERNDVILFCDSSQSKWKKEFCGLKVISPSELNLYKNYRIIITTSYFKEVSENLINLGINKFEIFYCLDYEIGLQYGDNKNSYFIRKIENQQDYYDFVVNYSPITNIIDYEQRNIFESDKKINKCEEINNFKCLKDAKNLIICPDFSIYISEYVKNLNKYTGIKFDILFYNDEKNCNYKKYKSECGNIVNNLYQYNNFKQLLSFINSMDNYNIIHIHFLAMVYGIIGKEIRKKCKRLFITIWGSDFHSSPVSSREVQRYVIEEADRITFENSILRDDFVNYYGNQYLMKTSLCLFGVSALEYIRKLDEVDKNFLRKKYNIPQNSIVVTCGTNPRPMQHHKDIINSIKKIRPDIYSNLYLIFPMTYGKGYDEHIYEIKNELKTLNCKYKVLEKFMTFDEIAELRKISDIMIQVQTKDSLSVTMLEYLYANNIIITGKWLPYKILKDLGIKYFEVDSINKIEDQVGQIIEYIVNERNSLTEDFKNNKNIVWKFSSWQNVYEGWESLYSIEV